MRVESFDPVTPPRALVVRGRRQTLAAVIDGSGSWGNGVEAADWSRKVLEPRWRDADHWSIDDLALEISSTAMTTPADLRESELGWSFSVTCVLCTDDLIECLAAGLYGVDVLDGSARTTLVRPKMWVDELLTAGKLTVETARTFPHKDVCLGPFVGDPAFVEFTRLRRQVAPGETVLEFNLARHDADGPSRPTSARNVAAQARPGSPPSPVILVSADG